MAHIENELEDDISIQEVEGQIRDSQNGVAVGYLHWYIFAKTEENAEVSRWTFFDACDAQSQELCDFAALLFSARKLDVTSMLRLGPIAFMHLLEVRPSYAGNGLGIQATKALAEYLQQKIGLHAAVMQPVPLQFDSAPDDQPSDPSAEQLFKHELRHLVSYYKRVLPLEEVQRGSGYFLWRFGNNGRPTPVVERTAPQKARPHRSRP
ncbi:MAG TPA: hypothetical protein VF173_26630 [Thermoanaerobaculia bacterium]|nr:hypothetical protein [Thermoanaerobaculia bacterium]